MGIQSHGEMLPLLTALGDLWIFNSASSMHCVITWRKIYSLKFLLLWPLNLCGKYTLGYCSGMECNEMLRTHSRAKMVSKLWHLSLDYWLPRWLCIWTLKVCLFVHPLASVPATASKKNIIFRDSKPWASTWTCHYLCLVGYRPRYQWVKKKLCLCSLRLYYMTLLSTKLACNFEHILDMSVYIYL